MTTQIIDCIEHSADFANAPECDDYKAEYSADEIIAQMKENEARRAKLVADEQTLRGLKNGLGLFCTHRQKLHNEWCNVKDGIESLQADWDALEAKRQEIISSAACTGCHVLDIEDFIAPVMGRGEVGSDAK